MRTRLHRSRSLPVIAALAAFLIAGHDAVAERPPKRDTRALPQADKPASEFRGENRGRLKGVKARSRLATDERKADNKQAEVLFGISWFRSLDSASHAAGQGKPLDECKPIFCFRVLGDLAGFM
jgi:hypothetical protein